MLTDDIRTRMKEAMKAQRVVERDILRLALGEIQRVEATKGADLTDEDAHKIIRKIIKSNEETRDSAGDRAELITKIEQELVILESLLPKLWGVDEIVAAVPADEIKAAKSDGQATGVAMKHLKAAGAPVDGKTVTEAVKKIRGA